MADIHRQCALAPRSGAGHHTIVRFFRFLCRHPIAVPLLALAVAGLVLFSARFVREGMYFADPAHQQQDLEPWMSPRYIGKSWGLPRDTMIAIMELEPDGDRRITVEDVMKRTGLTLPELQDRVEQARERQDEAIARGEGPPDRPAFPKPDFGRGGGGPDGKDRTAHD